MNVEKSILAAAYVELCRGNPDPLVAMVSDDCLDNVSGERGAGIWLIVTDWLARTFSDVIVDLHAVAQEGNHVLVWVTLSGTHIGSAFPWMRDRPPSGRRVSWPQLHVFRLDEDVVVEHWAVRDDLRVLEAIDRAE